MKFPYKPAGRLLAIALILPALQMSGAGCAAGKYQTLRTVSGWNIRHPLPLRILIYIVFIIVPVYAVAAILDIVIFNTIDFWEGRSVSGRNTVEKDGMLFAFENSFQPNGKRQSQIQVLAADGKPTLLELIDRESGSIELLIDGEKRAEIQDVKDFWMNLRTYTENGTLRESIFLDPAEVQNWETFDDFKNDPRILRGHWVAGSPSGI